MTISFLMIVIGILFLYFSAEWIVKGASDLAVGAGIPPLVVGVTVVSFCTSLPEAVASFVSLFAENGIDIAIGNVLGSNIANIGLILGLTAIITPIAASERVIRWEMPALMAVTFGSASFLVTGYLSRGAGGALMAGLIAYIIFQLIEAREFNRLHQHVPEAEGELKKDLGYIAVGCLGLILGGWLLVEGSVNVARIYGISERVIGVTIVAFGTSCPELATSLVAAVRGKNDLSIGNVIGSNIFNLLFILGGVGLAGPGEFSNGLVFIDVPVMMVFTLGCWMSVLITPEVTRWKGMGLFACYIVYILALLL